MSKIALPPVETLDLFLPMRAELVRILEDLKPSQWSRPTACTGWSVKDVAQHILGDDLGILSWQRDGHSMAGNIQSHADLITFINAANDQWVTTTRRLSPRMICDLLFVMGDSVHEFFASRDPDEIGPVVSWAGDNPAPYWMEIAREYTEYWMHHQHICDAVGITSLKDRTFMLPALDTFMRALPHNYRHTAAPPDTLIRVWITGEAGSVWNLLREGATWQLYAEVEQPSHALITLDGDTAWRLFTKGITPEEAQRRGNITIEGNEKLAAPFLNTVAIIA